MQKIINKLLLLFQSLINAILILLKFKMKFIMDLRKKQELIRYYFQKMIKVIFGYQTQWFLLCKTWLLFNLNFQNQNLLKVLEHMMKLKNNEKHIRNFQAI